jgi:hypothetical protein
VTVRVHVKEVNGNVVDTTELDATLDESGIVPLGDYHPNFPSPGLYQIQYTVLEGLDDEQTPAPPFSGTVMQSGYGRRKTNTQ